MKYFENHKKILEENALDTIKDWKQLTEEQKIKYFQEVLRIVLDKASGKKKNF